MLKMNSYCRAVGVAIVAMAAALVLPIGRDGSRVDAGSPPVPPLPGEAFEGCGTLHIAQSQGVTCDSIDTHTGGIYIISDPGGFDDGQEVCITGVIAVCSAAESSCGPSVACVTVGTIVPHGGTSLGIPTMGISTCGTFQRTSGQDATCVLFVSDAGWSYSVSGVSLGDPMELVGQRRFVSGEILLDGCMSPCGPVQGCLVNPRINECGAPIVPGDLNGDGHVNALDLGILLSNWSIPMASPGCAGATPCTADLNADGLVNTLDLGMLLSHWG